MYLNAQVTNRRHSFEKQNRAIIARESRKVAKLRGMLAAAKIKESGSLSIERKRISRESFATSNTKQQKKILENRVFACKSSKNPDIQRYPSQFKTKVDFSLTKIHNINQYRSDSSPFDSNDDSTGEVNYVEWFRESIKPLVKTSTKDFISLSFTHEQCMQRNIGSDVNGSFGFQTTQSYLCPNLSPFMKERPSSEPSKNVNSSSRFQARIDNEYFSDFSSDEYVGMENVRNLSSLPLREYRQSRKSCSRPIKNKVSIKNLGSGSQRKIRINNLIKNRDEVISSCLKTNCDKIIPVLKTQEKLNHLDSVLNRFDERNLSMKPNIERLEKQSDDLEERAKYIDKILSPANVSSNNYPLQYMITNNDRSASSSDTDDVNLSSTSSAPSDEY